MKKTLKLHTLLTSSDISFLMEAHNGISAKIAEEAGFQGIWGSGLSISASLGIRDSNEASWTQVLEVAEFMSDATNIPILLDCDTGYGNFNNVRRLVKKLEQRNIAGLCIEDKLFPKRNSFINIHEQVLEKTSVFCNKIKAACDTMVDDKFCIVARCEALIYGQSIEHTLERAKAYQQAGATAIVVHSKLNHAKQIEDFMRKWDDSCPIIIIPTTYYNTHTSLFKDMGVSTIIWANHLLRTSIQAMQKTANEIYNDQSVINVENQISSLQEIFRLQNEEELKKAEEKYLQ